MNKRFNSTLVFLTISFISFFPLPAYCGNMEQQNGATFFDLKAKGIDGEEVALEQYRGQVVLVVNTASRCGFTPQYEELQKLYSTYHSQGFTVLAFPSNDFANQEPGINKEIKEFCILKYGISFPMFSKGSVKGDDMQPVFQYLTEQCPKEYGGEVGWNFEKFLVGRDGQVKARYGSFTNPMSSRVKKKIEELLKEGA